MTANGLVCSLLLDPTTYTPDTLNLNADEEARQYWFNCFGQLIKKFSEQAARSGNYEDSDADERAKRYYEDCMEIIHTIRDDNEREGAITIRNLLEISDSCLRLNGFQDPWLAEKSTENSISLSKLSERLSDLDRITQRSEKWMEIFKGVFAGNIFDWGALVVAQILENNESFGLNDALKRIQPRPWLIDGFDAWIKRLEGPVHNCAVIFVDNSGVDFILGIVPFARELLNRGTKVIFCANKQPSLNDITIDELDAVLRKCCDKCDIIKKAYESQQILIYANGQNSVCLDLRHISPELNEAIKLHSVDLLVIEGMARALHTNLNAKFKCETLKLAVVKNKWLANRLGGDTFSIICKYEQPPMIRPSAGIGTECETNEIKAITTNRDTITTSHQS